ncbi:MAG: NAD-dependent epimerase/dehydratase family protein [Gemmatimonadetes bacterium]|nr:NAD-dependent epimerase/dehydratase family protein [Gemmatimonadota bacterium]
MAGRAVVSGGAGFIGRRLVARLLSGGWNVAVLDALVPAVHGPDAGPPAELDGARFVRGDARDADAWREVLAGDADVVWHLAAETGTGESMYRARRYVDVNVGGTALLCDLLADGAADPGRVVLAGSRAVYGEGPWTCASCGPVYPGPRAADALARGAWEPDCPGCGGGLEPLPAGQGTRLDPASVYALTKRDQEDILRLLLPPRGVEVLTLRLQNVYGPGQSLRNPYTGILSIFSVRLLDGEPVSVFEDGRESRDFVYVEDVVDALVAAADAPLPADAAGALTVDVGSGRATSVHDVALRLARLYGADPSAVRVTGEYRMGDIRHGRADVSALRRLLGEVPETTLDEGLTALADWVRAHERGASALEGALAEMRERGLLGRAGGSEG